MKMGAFFAKGGHDAARSADFDFAEISGERQHLTRPKRRKDGAPTILVVRTQDQKPGPAALSHRAHIQSFA